MKLHQTFIPFLIVLIILIITVSYADKIAEDIHNTPQVVQVLKAYVSDGSRDLYQYEEINDAMPVSNDAFKNDSLYQSGVTLYQKGNYADAEIYFTTLLSKYPLNPEILNYAGLIEMKNYNYLSAIRQFKQAVQKDSTYFPSYINLGIVYTKTGDYAQAKAAYEKAISSNKNNPKPYLNLGILHCKTEEWPKAASILSKGTELSSGKTKAKILSYLGLSRAFMGDTTAASENLNNAILLYPDYLFPRLHLANLSKNPQKRKEELNKLIRLNPDYAPAYYYLGMIYNDEKDLEKSERYFYEAIKLNPGDRDLAEILGSFYIENELIDKAEQYFTEMFQGDTLLPQNYFFKAKIASRKNELNEAIAFYNKAIQKANNNYPEAYLNKGILHKKQGDILNAIESYRKAATQKEDYYAAFYNLALAYEATKNIQKAIEHYEKALKIDSTSSKAFYNLGSLYLESKNYKKAERLYKKAISMDPDYTKAYYNLAVTYSQKGDGDQAIATYQTLLKKSPNFDKAWYNLAIAYNNSNNIRAAIEAYEKAIDIDPDYTAAWKNLGNIYAQNNEVDKAMEVYLQSIELDLSDPELRFNLAIQYGKKKAYKQGIFHLNKAIELKPDYLKAYEKLIEFYSEINQKEGLLAATEKKLRQFPDKEELYELGREWHRTDNYRKAITIYSLAIEQGKTNSWVYYWKGKAYQESGNIDQAIENYKKCLKKEPEHKFGNYRLCLIYKDRDRDKSLYSKYLNKIIKIDRQFAIEKKLIEQ